MSEVDSVRDTDELRGCVCCAVSEAYHHDSFAREVCRALEGLGVEVHAFKFGHAFNSRNVGQPDHASDRYHDFVEALVRLVLNLDNPPLLLVVKDNLLNEAVQLNVPSEVEMLSIAG
tara:strand:+ start:7625 stop:7975 length:351 start_codon:yes stop_codon:yes gene_type:complete